MDIETARFRSARVAARGASLMVNYFSLFLLHRENRARHITVAVTPRRVTSRRRRYAPLLRRRDERVAAIVAHPPCHVRPNEEDFATYFRQSQKSV
jgi:hypothetical protein